MVVGAFNMLADSTTTTTTTEPRVERNSAQDSRQSDIHPPSQSTQSECKRVALFYCAVCSLTHPCTFSPLRLGVHAHHQPKTGAASLAPLLEHVTRCGDRSAPMALQGAAAVAAPPPCITSSSSGGHSLPVQLAEVAVAVRRAMSTAWRPRSMNYDPLWRNSRTLRSCHSNSSSSSISKQWCRQSWRQRWTSWPRYAMVFDCPSPFIV